MKEGDQFLRVGFNSIVRIKAIITHNKSKGKNIKLDKPIIEIEYLEGDKPSFTTYKTEIERLLTFNSWKKIQ